MLLSECISALDELYEKDLKKKEGSAEDAKLAIVPEKLREFYSAYQSMKFPFGKIYSIDDCLKASMAEPFRSEGWFCFGQDEYFSFWLCKESPDSDGLSFTTWDHELEEEIDDPAFAEIADLIQYLSDDYMDSELATMCSVSISGYTREAMRELRDVKNAFHSTVSMLDMKEKATKGSCKIKEKFHYYQAKRILRGMDLKYLKVTLKKTSGLY